MEEREHLKGLRRVSPCCIEPIFHPYEWNEDLFNDIHCLKCLGKVKEHWLINEKGEVVWPPPKEWVDRQPKRPKRKRCRRKVLLEQEPEPFRILY